MNEKDWKKLWQQAWAAYQEYIVTANDTFRLLSDIKLPASIEERERILTHRKIENEARERLQVERTNLFAALNHSGIRPADLDRIAHTPRGWLGA